MTSPASDSASFHPREGSVLTASLQPLQLADYYKLKQMTGLAIAPDGRRAAFVLQGFRQQENDRYESLFVVGTDGRQPPHRLTRGQTHDGGPAFSPDGRYLAFLSTREDELEVAAEKGMEAPPVAAAGGEPAAGAGEASGQGGKEKGEPKPQIWLLDLLWGGEPRQVTRHEEGVDSFSWSPDGRQLVFAARSPSAAQRRYLQSIRGEEDGEKAGKGPIVLNRVQHKYDGEGYLDEVRTHLYVVDVESRGVRPLTHGPCDEREPQWSPDGEWIAFVSNRTGDPDNNRRSDLWLIRPDGRAARRLTFGDVDARWPRWSPDGSRVAFVSNLEPENTYRTDHLLVVQVADAEPVADLAQEVGKGWATVGGVVPDAPGATAGSAEGAAAGAGVDADAGAAAVGAAVAGDAGAQAPDDPVARARVYPVPLRQTPYQVLTQELDRPAMAPPVWLDAAALMVPVADRGQIRLARCTLDGGAVLGFPDDRMAAAPLAAAAAGTVVAAVDRPETGLDLYAFPATELVGTGGAENGAAPRAAHAGGDPVRLTAVNAPLLSERRLARYERIAFRNPAGEEVEALVALPPGFDPAQGPAPLLANPHGGPQWLDRPRFRFDEQYWAGMGYLVLMVNYRGSISYGESFCAAIRGDWGPREHEDLMAGIDHLIARGWADPDRLFVTGFSYGGIMTNWAVGHTDRFRAAASEHGLWDYVSAFGTDDCHLWWQDDMGVPWQNEAQYRKSSPLSGLANIRTPLLITAGEEDWRCPLSQAEQLYLALKKRGVPTQLVIYQGERHAITRPRRAIDRIQRICRWFARYGGLPFTDESAAGYPDPS